MYPNHIPQAPKIPLKSRFDLLNSGKIEILFNDFLHTGKCTQNSFPTTSNIRFNFLYPCSTLFQ